MIHSRQLRRDPSFNTDTNTVRTAQTQSSKRDTTPAYSGFQVQEAAKLPAGMTLPCISSLDKIVFIIPQRRFYCHIFLYFFALPRRPERAAAFCPHRLYRGKFFAAASRFCKRPQSCTAAHGCMHRACSALLYPLRSHERSLFRCGSGCLSVFSQCAERFVIFYCTTLSSDSPFIYPKPPAGALRFSPVRLPPRRFGSRNAALFAPLTSCTAPRKICQKPCGTL